MLYWLLPCNNVNQSSVYICPLPLKPPSNPWPHPAPLGCHRALGWVPCVIPSVSHVVIHMFQCCPLNLPHLLLPALCPQASSLCLHLYSCPANRFINIVFLDSIQFSSVHSLSHLQLFARFHTYVLIYWFLFLWLISLSITGCRFIHLSKTESNVFPSMANIPLYICTITSLSIHLSVDI